MARGDRPSNLHRCETFENILYFLSDEQIFQGISFLQRYDWGILKISRSSAWFCTMCQLSIKTCLTLCPQQIVKIGLVKGEVLRLLRTNSSMTTYDEITSNFKTHLLARGYPHNLIEKVLLEIIFTERSLALKQENKTNKDNLSFVTTYESCQY